MTTLNCSIRCGLRGNCVTIKPGWGFSGDYQPGQYLGIGLRVGGCWHWRSYSLTSIPRRDKRLIAITSDESVKLDGATTLMEGGEKLGIQMPFGCRMGICQSCVLPLESGYVRDLRSGTEHRAGDRIQTCISAASGDCTIDI
jgi:ferredoxin